MNLRDKIRTRLALAWWKFRGYDQNVKFTISANGLCAKHLAIILPPDFDDFDVARHTLNYLFDKIQADHVTVLVRENFRTWFAPNNASIFPFDIARTNWLGFPDVNTCNAARMIGADVVIDLTPRYSPYASRLAAATEAPLRMTLDHEHANEFFNMIIKPEPDRPLSERYRVLLSYV